MEALSHTQLADEFVALRAEHASLGREHAAVHLRPHALDAHREHIVRRHSHRERIRAYLSELRDRRKVGQMDEAIIAADR